MVPRRQADYQHQLAIRKQGIVNTKHTAREIWADPTPRSLAMGSHRSITVNAICQASSYPFVGGVPQLKTAYRSGSGRRVSGQPHPLRRLSAQRMWLQSPSSVA
jgi:hypothetical protein